jgi:hypothetical protein
MFKQIFLWMLIFKSFSSLAMEENTILKFNVGGYKFETTSQTVLKSGGNYLNTLIKHPEMLRKDSEGNIFIDRFSEEGRILAVYMQSKILPSNIDIDIAISAADFFTHEKLKTYLQNQKSQFSHIKSLKGTLYGKIYCPECEKGKRLRSSSIAVSHLMSDHGAIIEKEIVDYDWRVVYKVPKKEQ